MPVTIKVNGQDNSVSHKGAMHFAKNTAPDVCKTPSPGGPVPIPYPVIMSLSSDLAKGTTTVKADGGNMIAIKGSEYSRCSGDEALRIELGRRSGQPPLLAYGPGEVRLPRSSAA